MTAGEERNGHKFNSLWNPGFLRSRDLKIYMEPIMCPFCGGTNLFQEDDYSLEMDFEYWTIHHWECLDCAQSFDKIEVMSSSNKFEEINESTIH